jgi:hypothetical protein
MQSTGNAASAFGLAPQGFNAMAGMPQAQTFAGGLQGYSSAPLYEQSLDKLFANAPAQYNAIKSRFIDPFTGARPNGGGFANAQQASQMASGGGGGNEGFFDQVHADRMAQMSSTGRYYGVNSQYNPHAGTMMTDSDGEWLDSNGDGVADYRDMSFGEDGRRQIGNIEKIGNFINPFKFVDGVQGSLFDFMGKGKSTMTPEQSMQIINDGAARYNRLRTDRGFNPNLGGIQGIGGLIGQPAFDGQAALKEREEAIAIAQSQARKQADEQARAIAMQNYLDKLEDQAASMAPILKRVQAAPQSNANDGPQWSPSPYSGYSKPNKNEGGRPTQSQSPF